MKKTILTVGALLGGLYFASASIIPYEWWQMNNANRALSATYNVWTVGSRQSDTVDYSGNSVVVTNFGPGGPLGGTAGITRTTCANASYYYPGTGSANLWAAYTNTAGGDLPPPPAYPTGWSLGLSNNWVMEFWFLALEDGTIAGATNGLIADIGSGASSGPGENAQERWGCELWTKNAGPGSGKVWVQCMCISTNTADQPTNTFQLGPDILVKNGNADNRWMHFAVVRDDAAQTVSFYTNGVLVASTNASVVMLNQNPPNVQNWPGAAGFPEWFGTFSKAETGGTVGMQGYLSDLRFSSFAQGAFSVSDLLTRPPGPSIVKSPASVTTFTNGQAVFQVIGAYDTSLTYQWYQGSTLLSGATTSKLIVPATSNTTFSCVLQDASGLTRTSAVATLTVTSPSVSKGLYQNAVLSTPGLVAYFPVDGCVNGGALTNVLDPTATYYGTLEGGASVSANTNTAFGQGGLYFPGQTLLAGNNGDVTIPNNPTWEFGSYPNAGFGTIEAVLYVDPSIAYENTTIEPYPVWFSSGSAGASYLTLAADPSYISVKVASGSYYSFPANIVGKLAHVAVVFDNNSNITVYVNGQVTAAGTASAPGLFDSASYGNPFYIGWDGVSSFNYSNEPPVGNQYFAERNLFRGGVDELAIYTNNLSAATIAQHYVNFSPSTSVPAIASQSQSQTLLAGGNPELKVGVGGAPPFTFGWTSNGVPVADATNAILATVGLAAGQSATYQAFVTNFFGSTNSAPIVLSYVAPSDAYSALVMSQHPVAYWRLDEQSPTNGAIAYDQAGAHNGTYFVAAGRTNLMYPTNSLLTGVSDTAMFFNGAQNSIIANVTVPWSAQINPNGPFTVEGFTIPGFNGAGGEGALLGSINTKAQGYALEGAYYNQSYEFEWGDGNPGNNNHIYTDANIIHRGEHRYVAGVYDGTTLYLYVGGPNGWRLDGSRTITTFVPNASAPFTIGSVGPPFNEGVPVTPIDEVAFYNYALTPTELSNHYAFLYSQPSVTQNPVNVTTNEMSTAILTAAATGFTLTYQWFGPSGQLSAAALNPDNTLKYPNGVTGATLAISECHPSDDGGYYLEAITPVGTQNSTPATLTVTADTTKPLLLGAAGLGTVTPPPVAGVPNVVYNTEPPFLVKLYFNKRIDPASGSVAANYTVYPVGNPGSPVTINAASVSVDTPAAQNALAEQFGSDSRLVFLETAGLTPGTKYVVQVSNVQDQDQTPNTIAAGATAYFRAPVLTQGVATWDYYYQIPTASDNVYTVLTSGQVPTYPYQPSSNAVVTALDSGQITGGDLNGKPLFGGAGDYFGDTVTAWLTPTNTGAYYFFLAADDYALLYMSTNNANSTTLGTADPYNAQQIAYVAAATGAYTETNGTAVQTANNVSQLISLQAGQSYFLQAMHMEITGGDYVRVAWRAAGATNAANTLTPIPAPFLSAYAPVPPPSFTSSTLANGQFTLNWTSYLNQGILQQSTDLTTWTAVPGNPNPLVVTPSAAQPVMYYRIAQ